MGDDGRPRETFAPKEREVEDLWRSQTKSGINFSKYDSIPVKTLGENKPSSITNFQTSGLATVLLENVRRVEYSVPTPVQKHGNANHHGRERSDGKRPDRQWKDGRLTPSHHRLHHLNQGSLGPKSLSAGTSGSDHHSHQGACHPDQ